LPEGGSALLGLSDPRDRTTAMRALVTALLLIVTATDAGAAEEADRAAIRGVIESQIEAFRRDDAAGAFAFAAPNIRERFGTDERFMAMVREGYRPVYRPRTYAMGELKETHVGLTQDVRIQDTEGEDWTAFYTVERQADGSWKITGCYLTKAPGERA